MSLINEIEHKIIYLNPKAVTKETPEPLREWMVAIADSLDEKVDENDYQRKEIRRVFELIEKDTISPDERAKMIEEYHLEEGKRKEENSDGQHYANCASSIRALHRGCGDFATTNFQIHVFLRGVKRIYK